MGARESLQKLADKKENEIGELKLQLAQAEAYLQAIQDSLRVLPKEPTDGGSEPELRSGTLLFQAKEVLRTAGKPMHINEILKKMNKPVDKNNRISLSGSMAAYVRKGVIFKKTGPNVFSLIGIDSTQQASSEASDDSEDQLPKSFGSVQ